MNDPRNYNPYEKPKPKNQKEAVLFHILEHGWIDFIVAASDLGVSQLTARISELMADGYRFDKRTKGGKNRYGHYFQKTIYYNARRASQAE